MTESSTTSNGGWVQTIVGMIAAVVTTFTLIYTLAVAPLAARVDALNTFREADRSTIANIYAQISVVEEYKKYLASRFDTIRADTTRIETAVTRTADEQQRRSVAVASIANVESRIDRISAALTDLNKQFSGSHTLGDELHRMQAELAELRSKMMGSGKL